MLPLDADLLPPSDDRIFKRILTAPGATPVLIDLLSAIIGQTVTSVVVRNNELPNDDANEKDERLDVNCCIDDGTQIDLEMQASRIRGRNGGIPNLIAKSIFYLCDLHSSQSAKGKEYSELARTWQVTLCSYTIFPDNDEYLNSFSLRNDRDNSLLSNATRMAFVELSKLEEVLKKPVEGMTALEKWAIFFGYANIPDQREVVNRVIESKEAFKMAGELLMTVSRDERERAIFRSRRMAQSDMESNYAAERNMGREEGRAEGRTEATNKMIRNMRTAGLSFEVIAQVSGMPIEYILSV